MTQLREDVIVLTGTTKLRGELFVGADALPELFAPVSDSLWQERTYRPATLPTEWTLSSPTCGELYIAWREIEEIRARLRRAQREEEAMSRPCDNCGAPNPCRCIEALPGRCEIEEKI